MAKRLNRDRVIEDLKLLAAGANGGAVVLGGDRPTIPRYLDAGSKVSFCWAVGERWFPDDQYKCALFRITDLNKWSDFETLADAIIEERKRLDRNAKQECGE